MKNEIKTKKKNIEDEANDLLTAIEKLQENHNAEVQVIHIEKSENNHIKTEIKSTNTNEEQEEETKNKYSIITAALVVAVIFLFILFLGMRYTEIKSAKQMDLFASIIEATLQSDETVLSENTTQASESESENISNGTTADKNSNLININTATTAELITLYGIGEAKASKIIEYREANGNFTSIYDILNVSGIGEKTFDKIKDFICVE